MTNDDLFSDLDPIDEDLDEKPQSIATKKKPKETEEEDLFSDFKNLDEELSSDDRLEKLRKEELKKTGVVVTKKEKKKEQKPGELFEDLNSSIEEDFESEDRVSKKRVPGRRTKRRVIKDADDITEDFFKETQHDNHSDKAPEELFDDLQTNNEEVIKDTTPAKAEVTRSPPSTSSNKKEEGDIFSDLDDFDLDL